MIYKILAAIVLVFLIASCNKKDIAETMLKSVHDDIVAQKDKELAEVRLQLEELKIQLNYEREVNALDSNKRRNENIRSLFAKE